MAILNTSMISASTSHEYAIIITKKNGTASIHHVNKVFDKVDPFIHSIVDVRKNPLNSRHFFIEENPEKVVDGELTLLSIEPQISGTGLTKFLSQGFLQGYMDIIHQCHFQPGAVTRKVAYRDLPLPFSFESFVKFVKVAYPMDYENWRLLDPNLVFTSQQLAIPSLN